jgi:hypothetical protein
MSACWWLICSAHAVFSVLTTVEAGNLSRDDDEQLACAISQERAFLTHNREDFEARAIRFFESGQKHYGISAVRHPPQELVRRLLLILNRVTADEMQNQVRYI